MTLSDWPVLPSGWEEWKLKKLIGKGSFGTVYLAEKAINDTVIKSAIKIIHMPPEKEDIEELAYETGSLEAAESYIASAAEQCLSEIQAMYELRGTSSHIVSIEDSRMVKDENGPGCTIFLRMEYLQPLEDYQAVHPMTEADVIQLGMDICSALSTCASLGIIHRDVKPGNIYVGRLGQFKLGDFGTAKFIMPGSETRTLQGSEGYMAPEVYFRKPYDGRADIYSLGLVMYRILNHGRAPFVDPYRQILRPKDYENAKVRRLQGEPFPDPADASGELAEVLRTAAAYDPDQRYRDADAFSGALQAIADRSIPSASHKSDEKPEIPDRTEAAVKEPAPEAPPRKPGRLLPLLICLLIPAVAAGIYLAATVKKEPREEARKQEAEYSTETITEKPSVETTQEAVTEAAEQAPPAEENSRLSSYTEMIIAGESDQALSLENQFAHLAYEDLLREYDAFFKEADENNWDIFVDDNGVSTAAPYWKETYPNAVTALNTIAKPSEIPDWHSEYKDLDGNGIDELLVYFTKEPLVRDDALSGSSPMSLYAFDWNRPVNLATAPYVFIGTDGYVMELRHQHGGSIYFCLKRMSGYQTEVIQEGSLETAELNGQVILSQPASDYLQNLLSGIRTGSE